MLIPGGETWHRDVFAILHAEEVHLGAVQRAVAVEAVGHGCVEV